ncbi:hypothetical protein L1987_83107 [Smallanthus sonchifolius]|uniref:Uncharacterized protein n=1 Tax=Smallanthus sonchifolius TaxID=185202 RepID=A0ACB8YFR7_9ASTR|nr:hypothetical protein L1987_83107 [Smallanthus sonchifolius]
MFFDDDGDEAIASGRLRIKTSCFGRISETIMVTIDVVTLEVFVKEFAWWCPSFKKLGGSNRQSDGSLDDSTDTSSNVGGSESGNDDVKKQYSMADENLVIEMELEEGEVPKTNAESQQPISVDPFSIYKVIDHLDDLGPKNQKIDAPFSRTPVDDWTCSVHSSFPSKPPGFGEFVN